eukprot:scaffold42334_cov65-Phaeocystis_antarctica.AAC.2
MITRPEDEEVGLARLLPCRCASVPPPPPPPPPLLPPLPLPLSPSFPCWRAQPRVVHVVLRAAQPAMVSRANAEQQSARLLQAHGPPCMARRRWRCLGAWGRGAEATRRHMPPRVFSYNQRCHFACHRRSAVGCYLSPFTRHGSVRTSCRALDGARQPAQDTPHRGARRGHSPTAKGPQTPRPEREPDGDGPLAVGDGGHHV